MIERVNLGKKGLHFAEVLSQGSARKSLQNVYTEYSVFFVATSLAVLSAPFTVNVFRYLTPEKYQRKMLDGNFAVLHHSESPTET